MIFLPFQPIENLHISLAAADCHIVSLGNNISGFCHPCKVYGAFLAAKPIIYLGPKNSFIQDYLNQLNGNISVRHNDTITLKEKLIQLQQSSELDLIGKQNKAFVENNINKDRLFKETITSLIK